MNNHNNPAEFRAETRSGAFAGVTAGVAPGYTQANLAILPKEYAFDFLLFCQRNRKPCPLIEVLEPGQTEPRASAPGADIRTDLPAYRVYRDGVLEAEVPDIAEYWRDDMVSFLLGCSFTFEEALMRAQIPMRHIEQGSNVSMYVDEHGDPERWGVLGADGGEYEAGSPLAGCQGGAGDVPVPGRTRGAGARRGAGGQSG